MGHFSELAAEMDLDDGWAAYQSDLECRQAECERILAKVAPYLTTGELFTLRYECGLS